MVVVPLALLRLHVELTSMKLAELIRRVEEVEQSVLDSHNIADFDSLIRTLHSSNAELIKLERQRNFEKKLAASILHLISRYRQPHSNYQEIKFGNLEVRSNSQVIFNVQNAPDQTDSSGLQTKKPFKVLSSYAAMQEQRSHGLEYDIAVLPRRIQNQFTAVGDPAQIYALRFP